VSPSKSIVISACLMGTGQDRSPDPKNNKALEIDDGSDHNQYLKFSSLGGYNPLRGGRF